MLIVCNLLRFLSFFSHHVWRIQLYCGWSICGWMPGRISTGLKVGRISIIPFLLLGGVVINRDVVRSTIIPQLGG